MTNNINNFSMVNTLCETVKKHNIEKYLNKNTNAKLLVLNLDDLNADIITQLQAKQCRMVVLDEGNFRIIEDAQLNSVHHLQLTIDGDKQWVAIDHIIRFEANSNYTYVYIEDFSKPILTSRTLKHYVNLLDKTSFIRLHNKHFVNLRYIKKLTKNYSIQLKNGTALPVSRRKLSYVKKMLWHY